MSHHPDGQVEHHGVQSTLLLAAAYDRETHALEVQFVDGRTVRFLKVPEVHFRDLLSAFSKGQYFRTHIQGRYQAQHIR